MTYLVWRQHRSQALFAALALLAFTVLIVVTGVHMGGDYSAAQRACGSGACSELNQLFRGDGALFDIVGLTAAVPALFGLFWGAPIVAREMDEGTVRLAWTQSVTRRRWLMVQTGWMVLGAAAWGAALSVLVAWWSGAVHQPRFDAGHFDVQGLVPVAYSVFAVSLGISAGALLKRVLPALAATIGIFAGARFLVRNYLRPHYMAALTQTLPFGAPESGPPGAWYLASDYVYPDGHMSSTLQLRAADMPVACRGLLGRGLGQLEHCLGTHGYSTIISYQPAGRYWAFQGVEAGIFLALAGICILLAFRLVSRADA